MKSSVKQISELTGYSPSTVSNALNNKKGVNKETSDQIWKVAREIGYISTSKISNIKFVIYKKEGQVVSDTPFFAFLMDSVENACREAGFQTIIYNINQAKEDFNQRLDEILDDSNSGILLLATEITKEDIEAFKNAVCPLVILDAWFDNMRFDTVLANNEDSVYDATKYLIKNGHKKIGYLSSSIRIRNFVQRRYGYRKAMREYGIEVTSQYQISLTPTMEGAHKDMR